MTTDARIAREQEAMRHQEGSRLEASEQPNAAAMGAESAHYIEPTLDPQWIDAWKMFSDRDGSEYGVPVKLPRGQWDKGGPDALQNLRRPDGGYWFTLIEPARVMPAAQYECFVGDCRKRLQHRIQLIHHVRTFHFTEAEAYKSVLQRIEEQVAQDDPRLQRVLASLEQPEEHQPEAEPVGCDVCDTVSPEGHASPEAWLRGHKLGAHKEQS